MPSTWESIKTLHRQTTAGAKEGLAFRYFSRPLASFILHFIQHRHITPNQVTILSLGVGLAGTVVHVAMLSWGGLLLGGALFMAAHVLDALDGQLARHRRAGSVLGMHFDYFVDGVKAFLMYGALSLRLVRQASGEGSGAAPFGAEALSSPITLLRPLLDLGGTSALLVGALVGLGALATGVACTDFMKRPEWKSAFPSPSPADDRHLAPFRRVLAAGETVGHFVVDYPSYILLLCLANRIDLYYLAYTLVVTLYAVRALGGISLKLWRVNPYARSEDPGPDHPA